MTRRAKCEKEAALGYRAKERLTQLIRNAAGDLGAWRCTDIYGRTLATIAADGADLGEALIAEDLATRWPARADWCGFRR